jgi:type 1 glutamine amidotransferase
MNRDRSTARSRAGTALAAAFILLGGLSSAALADNDGRRLDTRSGLTPDLNDPKISGNPDYGVCRGTNPKCYHNWVDDRENRVLVYSRTAGPRHANLGPALPPGRFTPENGYGAGTVTAAHTVQMALVRWLGAHQILVDITEDVTQLSNLNRYKAVIFASPTRDTLWKHGTAVSPTSAVNTTTNAHLDAAKTALRQYMRAGGGFVGIHNAFGTEYNWPYYEGLLGNANYYDHGANQDGEAVVVAQDSSTAGLPPRWLFRDEWYNLRPFPTKVKFLLTVDENTLATRRSTHPGHGKFHPVAWCQYYDGGRVWVTTLGHDRGAFTEGSGFPGQAEFQKLVTNGILSVVGALPFCSPDSRQNHHDDDDD